MSNPLVSVATPIPITFYDASGAGATGLTITSSARKAGTTTTVAATSITDRSNGDYDVLITFPSTGTWRLTSTTTIDGDPAIDLTDVTVLPAAADPAAIATAIADLFDQPVSDFTNSNTLGGRIKMITAGTRS